MYQPEFHPKVDKDLSKLDKNLRRDIRDKHIPKILHDPQRVGGNLTGKLAGLKSYSFAANRVEYRIIYDILEEKIIVLFLMVGSRENLYERLLRRLRR
jgi:addiction module RelE/StbE family toxin